MIWLGKKMGRHTRDVGNKTYLDFQDSRRYLLKGLYCWIKSQHGPSHTTLPITVMGCGW